MYRIASLLLALLAPCPALAHASEVARGGVEQGFRVVLIGAIVVGALLYAKGIIALWRKAGVGRGIRRGQSVNFALGWAALAASLGAAVHRPSANGQVPIERR